MKEKQILKQSQLEMSKTVVSGIGVALLFFAGVAFFGLGGAQAVSNALNSIRFPQAFADSESSANFGGSGNIQAMTSQSPQLLQSSVIQKRNSLQGKSPPARTGIILDPTKGEMALLTRVATRNAAQFSDGSIGILSEADVFRINKNLSDRDRADIKALDERRAAFIQSGGNPNLKRTGAEILRDKRIQEELAKQKLKSQFGADAFVNGKLFGNPNFAPSGIVTGQGALSEAQKVSLANVRRAIDPRNMSRAELEEIRRNRIINEQNRILENKLGKAGAATIAASGQSQREFLKSKGFNVSGSLSDRAIGDLIRKGVFKF